MRSTAIALAMVCAVAGVAHPQTVVFSGANAQTSPGGGTHSVLLVDGQYVVFFTDGTRIVYATSLDGVSFSAPAPASDTPASLGFSVARRGTTLGLVWAHNDASGYALWYREAAISGVALAFGAPTLVASHATDARGYLATLSYSAAGTPYIAAFDYGRTYTGPLGPGCGSTGRYRPTHYFLSGTWQVRSYCNNFDSLRDPNSIAVAPSGANMIVAAAIDANLSTGIVNDTDQLGEPWHMVPAIDHTLPGQLSAAQSVTQATDVHLLYRDGAGAVSYARQDGTLTGNNDLVLDVTVLHAAASNPALSRPTTAAGCYVALYTVGNSIRRRTFSGSIATLSAETIAFATGSAPARLSVELDAATAPALMWQDGSSIRFGFAPGGDPAVLTADPPTARADGASLVSFTSAPFRDACGAPIPAGSLVTITTSTGSIADADASPALAGTQLAADAGGQIAFSLVAPTSEGSARVAAMPITGGTNASVEVVFTGSSIPESCGDGVVDSEEQCDSNGVDTESCNAFDCQLPRCGDGYVNVAASEDCEAGALCDTTTCLYNFTVGGGCAGCGASHPHDAWPLGVCFGIAVLRRRRRRQRTSAASAAGSQLRARQSDGQSAR